MSEPEQPEEKKAQHGDKMIELRVRFWTHEIAEKPGHVVPKKGWDSGMVAMDNNETHGIDPDTPRPFSSFVELQQAIHDTLVAHGVSLKPSRVTKILLDTE